jgi:hypothetical protein
MQKFCIKPNYKICGIYLIYMAFTVASHVPEFQHMLHLAWVTNLMKQRR